MEKTVTSLGNLSLSTLQNTTQLCSILKETYQKSLQYYGIERDFKNYHVLLLNLESNEWNSQSSNGNASCGCKH